MNRLQQIEARLLEIRSELETKGENLTLDEIGTFETEVAALTEERAAINAAAEQRRSLLNSIAVGNTGGNVLGRMGIGGNVGGNGGEGENGLIVPDRFDTPMYRKHFMEFVCRGTPIPAEYRMSFTENGTPVSPEYRNTGALTTTGDTGAVIPSTIMNEIIMEAKTYGNIFSGVRRLNIQGGVSFPIMTLRPTASWITETEVSPTQKLEAVNSVMFSFYGLECRISQTLLVSVVTLDEFQRQFVPLAAEAMVKAIEISIVRGTGVGQMLGILNEPRIPKENRIILTAAEFGQWGEWKKKVFARMKKSYRNGSFIMAQGTFDGYIDGMTDTTGQPIGRVNYGIDGGETYRFGGRRIEIVEDEIMPAYEDAAVGDPVAIFMRLGDYAINSNMQMRMVHWTDHDTNQLRNKCIMILDGKVIEPYGILIIKKGE